MLFQNTFQHTVKPRNAAANVAGIKLKRQNRIVPRDLICECHWGFLTGRVLAYRVHIRATSGLKRGVAAMIPRIGHAPDATRAYTLRPGAYAILPLGRQVLLTLQSADIPDIQLPGGGIDPGESPLRALHREVMEETGWRIARPRRLGAFRRFVFMPDYDMWAEKLCHVYVAHPAYQVTDPAEPDHTTLFVESRDAVDLLGNDGDRMFLSRYFSQLR